MQYHLGRDGSQLGEFSEADIRSGLQTGRFLPTDLAWSAGMTDWKPLAQVLPDALPATEAATEAAESAPLSQVEVLPPGSSQPTAPSDFPAVPAPLGPAAWGQATPMVGQVPAPVTRPTPGTAIASLVLGIISLVTCSAGIILVIPGLICGHLALNQIKAPGANYDGRTLAITALVLNYVWIALFILTIIIMFVFGVFAAMSEKAH